MSSHVKEIHTERILFPVIYIYIATVFHHFTILVRLHFAIGLLRGEITKELLLFRDMLLVLPRANDF